MLPFPDDFHTVKDKRPTTGRRVAFDDAAMPQQLGQRADRGRAYNFNDGFSPARRSCSRCPGLDTPEALAATDAGAARTTSAL